MFTLADLEKMSDREHLPVPNLAESDLKQRKKALNQWKKRVFNNWMETHQNNPYPTEKQKQNLALKLGMTKKQINNWFINTRIVSPPPT